MASKRPVKNNPAIKFRNINGPVVEILRLGADGIITWFPAGCEPVKIRDKKMLCIALLDVVATVNGHDIAKAVEPELYREYLTKLAELTVIPDGTQIQ